MKALGENTSTKLMPRLCQSTVRMLPIVAVISRPSTLTMIWIAELEFQPVGNLLLYRDQRRTIIVRAPPFALDDLRTSGDFASIGQATIALQHPFGIGGGMEIFRLDASRGDDAPAQHRHVLDGRLRGGVLEEFAEATGLVGREYR